MEIYDHALIMPNQSHRHAFDAWSDYLSCLEKFNKKLRIWDVNPTAEEMAIHIAQTILAVLDRRKIINVTVDKIIVHEIHHGDGPQQPL